MQNPLATVAVVIVLVLFGFALYWMSVGDYTVAGLCFLSASIVIYYRENRPSLQYTPAQDKKDRRIGGWGRLHRTPHTDYCNELPVIAGDGVDNDR